MRHGCICSGPGRARGCGRHSYYRADTPPLPLVPSASGSSGAKRFSELHRGPGFSRPGISALCPYTCRPKKAGHHDWGERTVPRGACTELGLDAGYQQHARIWAGLQVGHRELDGWGLRREARKSRLSRSSHSASGLSRLRQNERPSRQTEFRRLLLLCTGENHKESRFCSKDKTSRGPM
jgi:hypothetical protein